MRRVLPCFLLLVFPSWLIAQDAPPAAQTQRAQARPKIGVALEGGGALGLAHIGVLQWFEEHHIPVDYVAGTSMGGLVGGFFATGMSPADMRTLIQHVDWDEILRDRDIDPATARQAIAG